MKLSVFTVMLPEYDLAEGAKLLAENGYEGVEWRVRNIEAPSQAAAAFWGNNRCTVNLDTILDESEDLRDLSKGAGLEICNLATYLAADEYDKIERVMEAAKVMGAPSLRVGVPRYNRTKPYGELFTEARESLAECEKLSKKHGIKSLVELHMGNITPSASAARRLLEAFDPKYIGAIFDPGNMMYEGYEAWRMGLQILGEYLGHVHAKNTLWVPTKVDERGTLQWQAQAAPMEVGMADWGQIIDDLKSVGYDGFISFEDIFQPAHRSESSPKRCLYASALSVTVCKRGHAPWPLHGVGMPFSAPMAHADTRGRIGECSWISWLWRIFFPRPSSRYRTPRGGPLCPVIDAHNHLFWGSSKADRAQEAERLLALMDEAGVQMIIDLTNAWDESLQVHLDALQYPYPDRFTVLLVWIGIA